MATLQESDTAPVSVPVGIDDVRAAHGRIARSIVRTPTLHSRTLSELTGATVYVKFENFQFTAAYKERGALNKLLQLDEGAKSRGVIAASAGNHAQGLAYHGARLGIPVTIVMSRPRLGREAMRVNRNAGSPDRRPGLARPSADALT